MLSQHPTSFIELIIIEMGDVNFNEKMHDVIARANPSQDGRTNAKHSILPVTVSTVNARTRKVPQPGKKYRTEAKLAKNYY